MTEQIPSEIAWVCLTQQGIDLALSLSAKFPKSKVYGKANRTQSPDYEFDNTVDLFQTLFVQGQSIVGVCASGIIIRSLGALVADKNKEAPVLALAEDGSAIIPLLGGHHGANSIAKTIAHNLNIKAAVTTASDCQLGIALDDPPDGWILENKHQYKSFMAQLLAETKLKITGELPWLQSERISIDANAVLEVLCAHENSEGSEQKLVYHPKILALGVGCERGASAQELIDLIVHTLDANNLSASSIAGVYSIDIKQDEPAVHVLANKFNLPARFFDSNTLEKFSDRLLTPSEQVFKETGCHGVAEGAALAAAGSNARLLVAKTKSKRATCAIAIAEKVFDGSKPGQAQGQLFVVGIGPGNKEWRTPDACQAIQQASEVVGYFLYLDLVDDLINTQTCHRFDLGKEEDRVRKALELCASGKNVALVCSGDPGVYAMATLVFELIDRESGQTDWQRLDIKVIPGISALQTAAAKSGAPLGHDFCAISLSDLLTPWDSIKARVRAAAEGDFVIAFYNPVSRQRHWQLGEAKSILLNYRPHTTPVIIGRNLGRENESVIQTTLVDLDPATIDMLTVVLIGSSSTQTVALPGGRVHSYTPRGYDRKLSDTARD